jgi:hypothetical protein
MRAPAAPDRTGGHDLSEGGRRRRNDLTRTGNTGKFYQVAPQPDRKVGMGCALDP